MWEFAEFKVHLIVFSWPFEVALVRSRETCRAKRGHFPQRNIEVLVLNICIFCHFLVTLDTFVVYCLVDFFVLSRYEIVYLLLLIRSTGVLNDFFLIEDRVEPVYINL